MGASADPATLARALKIALLPLPPSTTSTPPSLDYKVSAKDAVGTSTSPNNIVNVPPLDNVHTTSVFAAKKGRVSGAKTGRTRHECSKSASNRYMEQDHMQRQDTLVL
ncbi:hypothetical protein AZE42_05213 [Rhizopogon vesiculosus]|uniref:Uncharacterized protein n=1 Tax=Rhizopogon vesiculosus TaxID=180088 RepID=A0A1J8Q047_9AGAM|nr:hypothetical protein AZE42_05213 [Rhizopogon vesiculosus]